MTFLLQILCNPLDFYVLFGFIFNIFFGTTWQQTEIQVVEHETRTISIYHSHCSPKQSCSSVWLHLGFPVNLLVRCSPSVLLLLYSNAQQPLDACYWPVSQWDSLSHCQISGNLTKEKKRYTLIQNNLRKSEAVLQNPTYIYMLTDLPALDNRYRRMEIKTKTLLKKVMCCNVLQRTWVF